MLLNSIKIRRHIKKIITLRQYNIVKRVVSQLEKNKLVLSQNTY